MDLEQSDLSYLISHKNLIVVVTFIGAFVREKQAATFDRCLAEILEKNPQWVVFYFRDMGNKMDAGFYPAFVKLQKAIRDKPAELRLCSLHPELRETLLEKAIVRKNELSPNLREAFIGYKPNDPK